MSWNVGAVPVGVGGALVGTATGAEIGAAAGEVTGGATGVGADSFTISMAVIMGFSTTATNSIVTIPFDTAVCVGCRGSTSCLHYIQVVDR
jgi:hypothetical protein